MDSTKVQAPRREGPATSLLKQLLIVGGKGGVGKTTLAAALAIGLAHRFPRRNVLVVSTDPAHSLHHALGTTGEAAELPANLEVVEVEIGDAFERFRRQHTEGLRKLVSRGAFLDEEDLERFLELGLPGLDELVALKFIADSLSAGTLDHIVVDTAPTGHALRLLALPGVIEHWRLALHAVAAKHRLMSMLYTRQHTPDEVDALLDSMERLVDVVRGTMQNIDRTTFLAVMNADPLSLWETQRLVARLETLKVAVPWIVMNKVPGKVASCAACTHRCEREALAIRDIRERFHAEFLEVPLFREEPRGPRMLAAVGRWLLEGDADFPEPAEQERQVRRPKLEHHPPLGKKAPGIARSRLFMVCGKGGVGKTTMACALALSLARRSGSKVLLLSTDPAHSLSDALARHVGDEPQTILDGLDAMEVRPEDRLLRLRELYREEIETLFDSLVPSRHMDATLDRAAMESLMDLCPPGLDEIMALAELAPHLREMTHDKFVIDSAPTGHFLRLLELPELMRAWIRAFFEILLKQRSMFRVPKVQRYLVELSQGIKQIQALLFDHEATSLLPVAIPTELSFQETRNLLAQTERLGLVARMGILNRMSLSTSTCSTCRSRSRNSERYLARYREAFPQCSFFCQEALEGSPIGIEMLDRIGRPLFG